MCGRQRRIARTTGRDIDKGRHAPTEGEIARVKIDADVVSDVALVLRGAQIDARDPAGQHATLSGRDAHLRQLTDAQGQDVILAEVKHVDVPAAQIGHDQQRDAWGRDLADLDVDGRDGARKWRKQLGLIHRRLRQRQRRLSLGDLSVSEIDLRRLGVVGHEIALGARRIERGLGLIDGRLALDGVEAHRGSPALTESPSATRVSSTRPPVWNDNRASRSGATRPSALMTAGSAAASRFGVGVAGTGAR